MKKLYLLAIGCVLVQSSFAQSFTFSTGVPIDTTVWTLATGITLIDSNVIEITQPIGSQAGYAYYDTPQVLTANAAFTVDFNFQIIPPPGASAGQAADGMAFWCISTPPTPGTTIVGTALGIPIYANGLILVLDTYDNDGNGNNPLETLLGFNGTEEQYNEGGSTGVLCPVVANQDFIEDGNWHHCKLTYQQGLINVYFNDSATPSLTGNYMLDQTVYFGFCGGTGANVSTQNINGVTITGTTDTTLTTGVSIVSLANNAITISPNPNKGNFIISTTSSALFGKQATIKLLTADGKTVLQSNVAFDNIGHININAAGVSKGTYMCEVVGDKIVAHSQVVIL